MPATQRGQAYRLGPNRWGLRYYDAAGERRRKSPFPSKSAALAHYRDVIEPRAARRAGAAARADARRVRRRSTSSATPPAVRPRTIDALRERLRLAIRRSATCRCATSSG